MASEYNVRLNLAAYHVGTRTLGPGIRSVVWVQGCPFHCQGCLSPQWIPNQDALLVPVPHLAHLLLSDPGVSGFTFSGGEPFRQAGSLAALIRSARRQRELSLICYSGYTLQQIKSLPASSGAQALLAQVDVLIDGPYCHELDDNRGMRGSSNQQIHYLTDRLKEYDFETQPRNVEIYVRNGEMLFVGVPPSGILKRITQDARLTQTMGGVYERA